MTNRQKDPRRRPSGVWIVSLIYVLSAGWTLLSFALIFSGAIKINAAQEAYFASLSGMDWFFSLAIAVISLSGAVSLFLLRRVAVLLFSVALGLNLALTAFLAMRMKMRMEWIEAFGVSGLTGVLLGLLILLVVIMYARGLAKKGLLS